MVEVQRRYGLILDIETVPGELHPRAAAYLAERRARGGSEGTLHRDRYAFHPLFSRVICVGLKRLGEEAQICLGEDERALLAWLWAELARTLPTPEAPLVTYNGYGFDLPFLGVRSALWGLPPTVGLNLNPWRMEGSNHLDLMRFLCGGQAFCWVPLGVACAQLGIEVPEEAFTVRGEDMACLYEQGEWEAIRRHNELDLELTEALYFRLFAH